jgi:hypothetical protein
MSEKATGAAAIALTRESHRTDLSDTAETGTADGTKDRTPAATADATS